MVIPIRKIRASIAVLTVVLFVGALFGDWLGMELTLFPGGVFLDGLGLFFIAYGVAAVYIVVRIFERFQSPYS